MNESRKDYLDNIRWAVVLLVLVYHVGYLYNGVGVPGGIPGAENLAGFDVFCTIVYPWFMVLLFVIAGITSRYSLEKRTSGQFIRERTEKLLIPSTVGLFVIHWIIGYLNIRINGGLAYIPKFLIYPVSALSGSGPLWFVQMLFVFSCFLLLLKKVDPRDKIWEMCGKAGIPVILCLYFVIWGASHVLNTPVITVYRFGIYLAAYLIGYYIFSHESVQKEIEKMRIPTLALAIAGGIAYVLKEYGGNYTEAGCLQSALTNAYLWAAVLAILGFGRRHCGVQTAFTRYMTQNSYGIYVLHYLVLMLTCCFLQYHTQLPAIWKYLLALILGTGGTLLLNEIIKRIPGIRLIVLGKR